MSKTPDPMSRFFGLVLMTVEALLGATSGLCTITMLGVGLKSALQAGHLEGLASLFIPLIFGFPMMILGLAVFRQGLKIWRPDRHTLPLDPLFEESDGE